MITSQEKERIRRDVVDRNPRHYDRPCHGFSDVNRTAEIVFSALQARAGLDNRPHIGDYVIHDGKPKRVAYRWTGYDDKAPEGFESLQLEPGRGSYHLCHKSGLCSMSGGLDTMVRIRVKRAANPKLGHCWVWKHGYPGAGEGANVTVPFTVWIVTEEM